MSDDIRLSVDALDHPKLMSLELQFGPQGPLSLIRLWAFAGKYHKDGTLAGIDRALLAAASRIPGADAQKWIDALIALRLLDVSDDGSPMRIHDWRDMQPWVCGAAKRSAAARKAAKARHQKPLNGHAPRSAERLRTAEHPQTSRTRIPDAPSPSPSPDPSPLQVQDHDRGSSTIKPLGKPPDLQRASAPENGAPARRLTLAQELHAMWQARGYRGDWGEDQWARAAAAIRKLGGIRTAVLPSWSAYLKDPAKFYEGHCPKKWASNPGAWPKPQRGLVESLADDDWEPPEERLTKQKGGAA